MNERTILADMLSYAERGELPKFKLLQNWGEYSYQRKTRQAIGAVIEFLDKSAKLQLKNYCKDIINGSTDVYKLLAFTALQKILNKYIAEYNIITDMLCEYEAFLIDGNLLDAYFGAQRPADHQWDHRGL